MPRLPDPVLAILEIDRDMSTLSIQCWSDFERVEDGRNRYPDRVLCEVFTGADPENNAAS